MLNMIKCKRKMERSNFTIIPHDSIMDVSNTSIFVIEYCI